ncbi:LysR substrate-binding domain-containing protein [Alloyangia pacifica]|uniref:Transcriptional regulator, LysR family n=1 Tax=Alloyangia pacifica TaxID=311180 RepID=A0A1I6QLJ2_9RHOB|nr:LysR substrate-binding domain-containing protein [Alloyangia pacifica]SDF92609.1 transcriptional regulator, LysR family [Alloyangia pacifica]SFS53335.1 transcriptional regulator, LysR family [Alloyangia pacifica]
MQQLDLNTLAQFVAVARHLNFRRAAAELAISPSTLSERIRELEARLGVRLLNRNTRSTSLTEDGERLLARTRDAIAVLDEAAAAVGSGRDAPLGGRIRINGPAPAIELRLMPLVTSFLARHPGVRIEAVSEGDLVDVVARGFDAGLRYDETLAQDMVAVRLGPDQRMLVAAAPEYLAARGTPLTPDDLAQHACITHVFGTGNTLPWSFEKDGRALDIRPQGRLSVNSSAAALVAARAGHGLIYAFDEYLSADLETGRLVQVLGDWTPAFPGPSLYFTERRLMPPALRAFIDHVKSHAPRV